MKANIPTLTYCVVLATALLFAPAASAKIIYTDIDPDITKSSTGNTKLDIDEDGVNDLEIDLNIMGLRDVWLTLNTLGETKISMLDWHTRLFQLYEFINDTCVWMNDVSLPLAYLTSGKPEGPWPGKTNTYMGFSFVKEGKILYGWMRIEVAENVKSYAIREIAYEDLENFPIMAGDKIKAVSVHHFNAESTTPQITQTSHTLHITTAEGSEPNKLVVTDLRGKILVCTEIKPGNNNVDLNMLPAGVYCVSVSDKRKTCNKKLWLY